ncbi:hypothetical protein EN742_14300 [Mesorhizobium sp. M4A.F.Ca.ET.020.02.1.1]|nr:hypothetical protein EN742_14300 [Mesorhizobium sp. M4A.F.Ca.ET.020.02.1.1]
MTQVAQRQSGLLCPCSPRVLRTCRCRGIRAQEELHPIALEAVQRLDVLFDIEPEINGLSAEVHACARQERSAQLMGTFAWLISLPSSDATTISPRPINHTCCADGRRLPAFSAMAESLHYGTTAERPLRCVPLGRKAWLFCGSDRGHRTVVICAHRHGQAQYVDPQACLTDVLARVAELPANPSTSCCRGTSASPPQSQPDNAHQQDPFRAKHRTRRAGTR